MFIKNKKVFYICLAISWVGTLGFIISSKGVPDVVDTICGIFIFLGIVAGIICGSLNLLIALVKISFKSWGIIIIHPLFLPIYWVFRFGIALFIIGIGGLGLCLCVPGVASTITWFKHRDELVG